ncbi:MAG: hypothetical protein NZ580_00640 [Bacteroidia bacterium]|nr:hypothetical protein [Bacteroidia bacterium]MDW8235201.1 hypothetical protein [Bacteroidia bacterium]
MREMRLPAPALWQVVRRLSEREYRVVRTSITSKRVAWLLETLRGMETYDEKGLIIAYRKAFRSASLDTLRTYKRLLWSALEQELVMSSEAYQAEMRIWHRLWLSEKLWSKGLGESAAILWQQAMNEALERGYIEIALWGFSVLELYLRDYWAFAPSAEVAAWGRQLVELVVQRYTAMTKKVEATEKHVISRQRGGLHLPPLPQEDSWGRYLSTYAQLFGVACHVCTEEALTIVVSQLEQLLQPPRYPERRIKGHLLLAFMNLGIQLLARRSTTSLYTQWWELFQKGYAKHFWEKEGIGKEIYQNALSLQVGYWMRAQQWHELDRFIQEHRSELEECIFSPWRGMAARAALACMLYAYYLLTGRLQEASQWRMRAEPWIEMHYRRDDPYLRWVFLRWYEAYKVGNCRLMRFWWRKLYRIWRTQFSALYWWKPIFPILRSLAGIWLPYHHRQLLEALTWWEKPDYCSFWDDYEALVFPMRQFLEEFLNKKSIDNRPCVAEPVPLSPELYVRLEKILTAMGEIIREPVPNLSQRVRVRGLVSQPEESRG